MSKLLLQRLVAQGIAVCLLLSGFVGAKCQSKANRAIQLAQTPPMGWNSWDAYGLTIGDEEFRRNVDVLAGLKELGWEYAVIDEGWYMQNPKEHETPERLRYEEDANGRFLPVPTRFPSAMSGDTNQGFAPIARYVHDRGLKFGIHIIRGIPKVSVERNTAIANSRYTASDAVDLSSPCPWDPTSWGVKDSPAGQAWYDSLLQQYASWGVDYIKVDCVSDHPYRSAEIRMIHQAIRRSGRAILLSLSPGPTSPALASEIASVAQMWRISDDVWDDWNKSTGVGRGIRDQFPLIAGWSPLAKPGAWPDADMLPFGYLGPEPGEGVARSTKLSLDEQRSMMTLWSISRSPLILGANLERLDPATRGLISNRDVLALNQRGVAQRQVSREGNVVTWTSRADGKTYLAIFNLNDKSREVRRPFSAYNLAKTSYAARDVWTGGTYVLSDEIAVTLAPHAVALLNLQ